MNKVQPSDCSSIEQSESASVTNEPDEPEGEDVSPSAVAPPIPKVQGLVDGKVDFSISTNNGK